MDQTRRRFLLGAAGALTGERRPNIIVILADDMGFSDVGCFGSEIDTPNINGLARGGLRFTQFYNTARCCPTRSSLLTGLYSHQTGIGHMVEDRKHPAYRGFLNDRCATIAEVLRPAGYQTLMVGKWHVGGNRPHWPLDRGFDRYYGLVDGGSNYWRLDPGRRLVRDNQIIQPEGPDFYMTDAFTREAAGMVKTAAAKPDPFFLYLAYTAPHWPLHARPQEIEKYRGKYRKGWDRLRQERHERQKAMGIVDRRWPLSPRDPNVPAWQDVPNKEEWDLRMAVYAAQIDRMDQGIGRVLDAVRNAGQESNTLVLFLSDNGGCAEENVRLEKEAADPNPGPANSFTSYRTPWANASNTPFRLYKHWVHEGGIATPLIARWPAAIRKRNTLTREPGHLIDILPTCADIAGARYPADKIPVEGRSLLPVLEGKARRPHEAIFWEHEGHRAVRQGSWKLVARHNQPWELYDLAADRTELSDLAAKDPERTRQMEAVYQAWAARCGVLPWDQVRKATD